MSAPVAEIPAAPVVEATPAETASTLEGGEEKQLQGGKRGRKRIFVKEKRPSRVGVCPCRNLKQSPRRYKSKMSGGGMYGMYGSPRRYGYGGMGMYGGASPSPLSGGKKKSRRYVRETRNSRLDRHPRCTCRDIKMSPRRSYRRSRS
jgi:hypothetical protein